MSYCKLRGAIREKFGTQEAFAVAMKMHPATLSGRLTGKTEWTRAEMKTVSTLLDIPIEKMHLYFFGPQVAFVQQIL